MADFPFQWVDILTEGTKITAWQQNADDGWFDLEIPFAFPWCARGPVVSYGRAGTSNLLWS